MLEGLAGSALTFSNISFDDFIFLFFAVLLENSVIFVSKNASLLTNTM